jgi:hypothetical protein
VLRTRNCLLAYLLGLPVPTSNKANISSSYVHGFRIRGWNFSDYLLELFRSETFPFLPLKTQYIDCVIRGGQRAI